MESFTLAYFYSLSYTEAFCIAMLEAASCGLLTVFLRYVAGIFLHCLSWISVSYQFSTLRIMSWTSWCSSDIFNFFALRFCQMTWLFWWNMILVIWWKQFRRQYIYYQILICQSCTVKWVSSFKRSFCDVICGWVNFLFVFFYPS